MGDGCLFCRIAAGEIPSQKVYEDETVFAFRDINPQAPTHILVIPKKHIARMSDCVAEDAALLGEVMYRAAEIARQEGVGDGFRTVVNCGESVGQSVWHIHVHVLGGRPMHWPPG
ncbi:MAG: histidine triad nucleotide-binding protein [Candidatus Hydrogenedentota bacterium]